MCFPDQVWEKNMTTKTLAKHGRLGKKNFFELSSLRIVEI